MLIAAWLLWGAWRASSHAIDQLMDKEWPEEQRAGVPCGGRANFPSLQGLHDLRTRTQRHAIISSQFHVWVPADWTVQRSA